MLKVPAPRLLPATIVAMSTLLLLKCGILLQVSFTHGAESEGGIVTAANAASTDQTKVVPKPAEPAKPSVAPAKAAVSEPPPAAPSPSPAPVPAGPPPISESEKALLQDLRQRRDDLDKRADTVVSRESVLIAAERKLGTRVEELQSLQKKLEVLSAAQKQKEDAGWEGLVKMYETMKPKDAATIFNDLSMPVLLQIMDRMKETKASSVMAAMNPDKARDLTAELAQMRTGHDASGAPLAGPKNNLPGG